MKNFVCLSVRVVVGARMLEQVTGRVRVSLYSTVGYVDKLTVCVCVCVCVQCVCVQCSGGRGGGGGGREGKGEK